MRTSDRWFARIPRDSRYNDGKAGRTINPTIPFIDTEYLFVLQNKQQNRCYYCAENMSWTERRKNLLGLTLERLDNDLPHYKNNCVLACKQCNSKRYSRETGLLTRYFKRWKQRALDPHVKVDDPRRPVYSR
jgi:hypothetical protein